MSQRTPDIQHTAAADGETRRVTLTPVIDVCMCSHAIKSCDRVKLIADTDKKDLPRNFGAKKFKCTAKRQKLGPNSLINLLSHLSTPASIPATAPPPFVVKTNPQLMTTPLARLGTFLFPSQGRRVSAPPPQSPHEPSKRRSAIATCDSPPRCRRRLSFADVDVVIEYPPSPVDVTPALRQRANAIVEAPLCERTQKWLEIAAIAKQPATHDGLHEAALRRAFETVFRESGSPEEILAAVSALDAVAEAPVPLAPGDASVVQKVLQTATVHVQDAPLVEAVAATVLRNDWGRVFAAALSDVSLPLVLALLSNLEAPDMKAQTWEASLQLLAVCSEACQRASQQDDSVKRSLQLTQAEAGVVLRSFERLADRNDACTESALRALRILLADRRVAAAFLQADGSAVLSEVSSMHANKLAVQHACIDVLVVLSAPKVLQYAK